MSYEDEQYEELDVEPAYEDPEELLDENPEIQLDELSKEFVLALIDKIMEFMK